MRKFYSSYRLVVFVLQNGKAKNTEPAMKFEMADELPGSARDDPDLEALHNIMILFLRYGWY